MTFAEPFWLIVAIPLAVAVWLWPMPTRLLLGLRIAALAMLVAAMAGLGVKLPGRSGVVVAVVDRSLSMPAGAQQSHEEACRLLQASMGRRDLLAVVSFGATAALEQPPANAPLAGLNAQVGPDASNLADALEMATSVIGADRPGRILVLSDGLWTGRDPSAVLARAVAAQVPIDYRMIRRAAASDLTIERLDAPATVGPGEGFALTAWLNVPAAQEVSYELYRGDALIGSGKRAMEAGTQRLSFRDLAAAPGALRYELRVTGASEDPMSENNRARLLVGVRGKLPVLCVHSSAGPSQLAALVGKGGLDVIDAAPANAKWELEDLANYSAVILEDVSAREVGEAGLANLAAWVRHSGRGLMVTGGRNSYGTGGYFKSSLESVLPVSMELRREHRKLSVAIAVVLDRSGSMMAPVEGGKRKMDLADLGTAQVLDLLSPMDELAVIAVDSSPHLIVPLGPVTDKDVSRERILAIESMGGGIFVYTGLAHAAQMLAGAGPMTRHIILFADAADAEEPGEYVALLEKCRAANITCSVIGLGTEADVDADFLKDVAARGGGRIYFTDKASELPLLFAQDTFIVARSSFVDEPTPVKPLAGLLSMTSSVPADVPDVGGYNLTYLRPEATLGMVTLDEYKAPVVASWHVGSGRVLCYTGQADGPMAGPIAAWEGVGELFTSMARWTAGADNPLPPTMLATQSLSEGLLRVRLLLDPQAQEAMGGALPTVNVLRGKAGAAPKTSAMKMQWVAPDELAIQVPLEGDQTAVASVGLADGPQVTLPPVCLPYSPEFRRRDERYATTSLADLARATGGIERLELADTWKDLPYWPRSLDLRPWLLLAAGLLLALEVLQRRTGLVAQAGTGAKAMMRRADLANRARAWWAAGSAARAQARAEKAMRVQSARTRRTKTGPDEAPPPATVATPEPAPPPAKPPKTDDDDLMSAMRTARRRLPKRRG